MIYLIADEDNPVFLANFAKVLKFVAREHDPGRVTGGAQDQSLRALKFTTEYQKYVWLQTFQSLQTGSLPFQHFLLYFVCSDFELTVYLNAHIF